MLPLTSVPTPGINNAINNKILISRNNQSVFSNKLDGVIKNIVNINIPIPINKACLVAK
jgi:hypothetical protein